MHGCSSTSVVLVNAEFDSMGGGVEGGVGIANKTSPRRAVIEKVQTELRQEYDVRDKRKRELEFLEKGGNPLDFKAWSAASVSVQSTSFTDLQPDQIVTSEAKGSIAFTTSPHGDSVESSGRLGANPCEPNTADNLLLFDAEHEFSEGDRNTLQPSRSDFVPSEKLSKMDGSHRPRKHGDSATFGLPRKAYKRRNRSRANRDGAGSSSTDVNPIRGSDGSSLPSSHGPREVKGLIPDAQTLNIPSNCDSKLTSPTDGALHSSELMDGQQGVELGGGKAVESTKDSIERIPVNVASDAIASETPLDNQNIQQSHPGAMKSPISDGPETIQLREVVTFEPIECQPNATAKKVVNHSSSQVMNGFSSNKRDRMKYVARNSRASRGKKQLDSDSTCTETGLRDVKNDGGIYTKTRNSEADGKNEDQPLVADVTLVVEGDGFVEGKRGTKCADRSTLNNVGSPSLSQSQRDNCSKPEEESNQSGSTLKKHVKDPNFVQGMEARGHSESESERKPAEIVGENPPHNENSCNKHEGPIDIPIADLPEGGLLTKVSTIPAEAQTSQSDSELTNKIDEDSILKEAQIIEAKRKRIAGLSIVTAPKIIHPKSHWDYVLDEMQWLANDFAQERVWKLAAAAQISSRVALTCRLRKKENSSIMEAKKIAHTLAKSVMEFWHSLEETNKLLEAQKSAKDGTHSVQAYALRFLKHNNSTVVHNQADLPLTPDNAIDMGVLDPSWEDNLTEENLFYTVPAGAMEMYRNSIESHVAQCEKIGNGLQEEVETSACGATADSESQDATCDEDEGETNTYDVSMAFEGSKSFKFSQKKRKHSPHAYGARSYEISSGLLPTQYGENKDVMQQSTLLVKRPGGSLNVSIPTKRVRTASRRVISPFSGTSGFVPVPIKTDASSGDTNSFPDDQSTLRGGSVAPNSLEVESIGDFGKQLQFEAAEVSTKHKKKKTKHPNAAYEPRWQVDSSFQYEQFQRDHLKKSHQLESNGSSGLLGQPMIKRSKTLRLSQDNSLENIVPIGGSVPSPAASQMSNMPNPNKFIKMLGGRDRGRKPKVLKMPAGQPGSGCPWTQFEDQALVVLVHDLGPNWELVSDAFNSTLQFKCIFRKAKECKERHYLLMDRTSGDGADSAEDSGSSQPYPSTLPGIPKGSARQLFQRLQGPIEEDTLKSHFEKIIIIGQKQKYRKNQNDNQDPKQLQQPHGSHTNALSQVCPNNLNGGSVLTPLDLCDATMGGPDVLPLGYQGPHSGGLPISNQGTLNPMHPASGTSSVLQGSPNTILGNNFSTSPGPLNSSVRDGRYGVPKSASLSADDQQRLQQFNQMLSGRNLAQPNVSVPGAPPGTDRGGRILPGGSAMGSASGINRSMPMARPGFQGIASPSMVNSGSVVSPGMPSANSHSGVGSGQGSSMFRPREALHMMRPGLSPDPKRQMMAPDLQMQVSPGNSHRPSHIGGLSPSQTASPPVSSYPLQHQPTHPVPPQQPQVRSPHHPHFQGPSNPQQQAYAIRVAKERHQHRLRQQQQQQQQLAASTSLMHQLPISSPVQSNSQGQPQTGSPLSPSKSAASAVNPVPHHQQKHQTCSGLTNQTGKHRQRQQQHFSETNRQHPQQQHQSTKVAKGVGRGNIPTDPTLINGFSSNPGNQSTEKGESATNVRSQGLYTGLQPSRQYVPQQKTYSGQAAMSTKHDNSSQNHTPAIASGSIHHSHPKLVNQNQTTLQRVGQPNKPQDRDCDSDQKRTSSSTEMDTVTTLPQAPNNANNSFQAASPAGAHQWNASEPLLDPNALNSATNSGELATQVGQGLGQRSSSANFPSIRHDVSSPVPQPQQLLHSQQQGQLLQAGNGGLYGRPGDNRLE